MARMYFQGESVHQIAEVRDVNGTLVDPDTIIISITDLTGANKVDEVAMDKEDTGEYSHDYLVPTDALVGLWTVEIKAIKGFTAIEQDHFTVLDSSTE